MIKETCSFKGDKKKWKKFVELVRKNHTQVWGVFGPFVEDYIEQHKDKLEEKE